MELKFIWIKDYSILKDLNLNFDHSGEHRFNFNGKELQLLANDNRILDFGPNINGVTAIAGQNGSGKSSICELVLSSVATLKRGMFGFEAPFEGIVCFGNQIFYQENIVIENTDILVEANYLLKAFKESPLENERMDYWEETGTSAFVNNGFIYYSNVLDIRSGFERVNMANISTQKILQDEYQHGTNFHKDQAIYKESDITRYLFGQAYRITDFYLQHIEFIPFKGPQFFSLKSVYSQNSRWLNITTEDDDYRFKIDTLEQRIFDQIFEKYSEVSHDFRTDIEPEIFKKTIHHLYRLNIIRSIIAATSYRPEISQIEGFVFDKKNLDTDYREVNVLATIHERIIANSEIPEGSFQPFILRHDHKFPKDWRFHLIEQVWLPNTTINRHLLKGLIFFEKRLFSKLERPIGRISNYSFWPYFSAGEYSFLTFYSRIYDVVNRLNSGTKEQDKIVFFIDEAEVGFHPAWKKKFLTFLLRYLNSYVSGYTFQLIITTHSPYLLSDLSSPNVLLIKKGNDGFTQVVPSEYFSTFGANIHELLANTFFLEDGTIGDFAKEKIQWCIDRLNEWRLKKSEHTDFEVPTDLKRQVTDIISIISDSIVRNKLYEIYWEIFEDTGITDEEIRILEERIQQLKSRKK